MWYYALQEAPEALIRIQPAENVNEGQVTLNRGYVPVPGHSFTNPCARNAPGTGFLKES